jgi:hypothetical protein
MLLIVIIPLQILAIIWLILTKELPVRELIPQDTKKFCFHKNFLFHI